MGVTRSYDVIKTLKLKKKLAFSKTHIWRSNNGRDVNQGYTRRIEDGITNFGKKRTRNGGKMNV